MQTLFNPVLFSVLSAHAHRLFLAVSMSTETPRHKRQDTQDTHLEHAGCVTCSPFGRRTTKRRTRVSAVSFFLCLPTLPSCPTSKGHSLRGPYHCFGFFPSFLFIFLYHFFAPFHQQQIWLILLHLASFLPHTPASHVRHRFLPPLQDKQDIFLQELSCALCCFSSCYTGLRLLL